MLKKAFAVSIIASAIAFAHCDGLDGPVVQAARRAISTGQVAHVLPWVPESEEATVRGAFLRAQAVRKLSGDAEQLADTWFFETVVRVHRVGEGAGFTGLKPTGTQLPAAIRLADEAIERGGTKALESALPESMRADVRQRFSRVMALKNYDPANVKAGREYVAAYVEFMHFVEHSATPAQTHESDHNH